MTNRKFYPRGPRTLSEKQRAPLRRIVSFVDGGGETVEILECGHRIRHWRRLPTTAARRRCVRCALSAAEARS